MTGAQAAVLDRAREGDREAFQVLVQEHSESMYRLAYRMTGNNQDAEDVVQETFLRAYRKLRRFESRAHFSSWIHRIAANYSIDLLRRRKRWRFASTDDLEETTVLSSREPGPERAAFATEVQDRLEDALARLTPKERVAFALRHYEDMSIAEIGKTLGTRTSATKNTVFRAVHKLRRMLEPMLEPER